MFWIFTGAEIAILSLAIFGCIGGFVQVQKLSHSLQQQPYDLDQLLSSVTIVGAYIYAIFSMIAAGVSLDSLETKTILVFIQNVLLMMQVSCQGKSCSTPEMEIRRKHKYVICAYQCLARSDMTFCRNDCRRGWSPNLLDTRPTDGQAWQATDHFLAVCQHHTVGARHLHDTQLDHTRTPVAILRTLGVGNHFKDKFALAHLLPLPLLRCLGRNLEKHISYKRKLLRLPRAYSHTPPPSIVGENAKAAAATSFKTMLDLKQ